VVLNLAHGKIKKLRKNSLVMRYVEDGVVEELYYYGLIFWK
jgi:hypothetical protein